MEILDGIRSQLSELVEYAFKEGYEACSEDAVKSMRECGFTSPEEAYQKGLDDAWECARKIMRMGSTKQEEIFCVHGDLEILERLHPSTAISKIKAYEEKKKAGEEEIKIGDEVKNKKGKRTIVTAFWNTGSVSTIDVVTGKTYIEEPSKLLKTGRSFPQIAEVLKQLQEGYRCRS